MPRNYVRFQRGSKEAYQDLLDRNAVDLNTLYFIYAEGESTGSLYMGKKLISGGDTIITSASLDDLADVIIKGANTNSFLVKAEDGNWIAKSLEDVIDLIKNYSEDFIKSVQIFQVILNENEEDIDAINRIVNDTLISAGDIVIVKKIIINNKYQHTAYIYDNNNWVAMDGNYSIDNIFTSEDIQVTTDIGELSANTIINAGTSFADLLAQILSKSKNPLKIDPSIISFTVTNNNNNGTSFEAGTLITPTWNLIVDLGSYTYKSTVSKKDIIPVSGTGVITTNQSIKKNNIKIGIENTGIGESFILNDEPISFEAIVDYSDGNYALTNLNELPEEDVRIEQGTVSKTSVITPYRKMFIGGITGQEINSELIRNLNISKPASIYSSTEFTTKVGDTQLIFAYPADLTDKTPKFEYFTMAWESFNKFKKIENVSVADARGDSYGLKDYIVYSYIPAAAYETETKYRISF